MAPPIDEGSVTLTPHDLRGTHHAEIVVFTKDTEGPGATGVCYNSLGVTDDVSDAEFDTRFRSLDPDSLTSAFHGDAVWMNGPRRALMDSATAQAFDDGRVTPVGEIPMLTVATVHVPDLNRFFGSTRPPYTEFTVGRTTQWVFAKGQEVYELVAPTGAVYVMQSCSQNVDPNLTVERLATLGQRLHVPAGWQYRARTLDEDLVVRAERGGNQAHIVLDEFENNYQRIDN